nr:integrase, catalytic region, zinc finger, CCHC-type, peptidase aspartic, catalytic [Tanacetum cinerariifolium]
MLMGNTRLTKDVCTRPEVQDPDNDIAHVSKKHEVHEIHYEVQHTNVLDLDSADMDNSNIIPYEQYVKHNEGLVIHGGESSVPNDAYVMDENSAYVLDDSFSTTLNIYKDQTRTVELEAEILNLHKKIQNDDHNNMVKHLSRLDVDNLNLQLKYQHLKDRTKTSKSRTSKDAPKFDAFFELNKKDAQLQTHQNTIRKLKAQISQLKSNKSDVTGTLFPQPLESQNFQLQDTINKLQKENDCFQAENSKINIITKRSQPRSNIKIDRTLTAKSGHKKNIEAHLRNNKSDLHKKNRVDSGISFKPNVVNSNSNSHCKTCNKFSAAVAALRVVDLAGSPSLTTIDHVLSAKLSLLNAACIKALNLLKKGLMIRGEAVEASKRKRSLLDHKIQQLSKGLSEGSGIIPEVLDDPKDNYGSSSSLLS